MHQIQFIPFTETAWLLQWPKKIDKSVHAEVMQVYSYLQEYPLEGIHEMVPAYQSLAIYLEEGWLCNNSLWLDALKQKVQQALHHSSLASTNSSLIEIPVCYETEFAPDIQNVMEETGLSAEVIIQLHSSTIYEVMMMGFVPGFPYMGILPQILHTSRKVIPRSAVNPGSVAIAGNQTGIYPLQTPGGWNIIGRTPLPLVQLQRANEFLFAPGYQVKFKPIPRMVYDAFLNAPPNPFKINIQHDQN